MMPPDDDWAGRDYLDRFTDRRALAHRRGRRPTPRRTRRDGSTADP